MSASYVEQFFSSDMENKGIAKRPKQITRVSTRINKNKLKLFFFAAHGGAQFNFDKGQSPSQDLKVGLGIKPYDFVNFSRKIL